jgi:protoheme IX farnesyltransferase
MGESSSHRVRFESVTAHTSPLTASVPLGRTVAGYVALTKPRIIELLLVTTVPTMVVAERGLPSLWLMVATVIGGTLSAGGANAINMYVDRDIDAVMERTRNRPLVTGVIEPRAALTFAIGLEVVAFFWMWAFVNLLSAALAVSACLFYVFVYTLWLKRTSSQNIVIGGAAGAAPVLIGWSAVTNSLGWEPWVLFGVIFFWTPPHFWALAIKYKEDYANADVPMLPSVATLRHTADKIVAYTLVTVALTLVLAPVADLGWIYGAAAVLFGVAFTWLAFAVRRDPHTKRAMRLFSFSITYLVLLFGAMAADVLILG